MAKQEAEIESAAKGAKTTRRALRLESKRPNTTHHAALSELWEPAKTKTVPMEEPETKLQAAERLLAEAEADIARQKSIILDLQRGGRTAVGSKILLEMLKEARAKWQAVLRLLQKP